MMEKEKKVEELELVSIIIPVHNVERYLKHCIDSVLRQTYSNLEVILVDDGSTDSSAAMCDNYAERYDLVRVIHKQNEGAGAARNDGLALSKGKYIVFVDSDDYIGKKYIEGLYYALRAYHADISVSDCVHIAEDDDGRSKEESRGEIEIGTRNTYIISGRDGLCGKIVMPCGEEVPWGRMYKRTLFSDYKIAFPIGVGYEDTATVYKLLYYAKVIACIEMNEYYYRIRKGSLMHSSFSIKNLDIITVQEMKCRFFFEKQEHEILARNFNCYCKVVRECYEALQREYCKDDKKEKKQEIIQGLRRNLKLYSREKIGLMRWIFYYGFAYFPCKFIFGDFYRFWVRK